MSNRITIHNDADVDSQAFARPGVLLRLNRLFRFDELATHYGGPDSVWEKLRPGLPVFCVIDGDPIYLESIVDDFLKAVANGLQISPPIALPRTEEEPEYLSVAEAQRRYFNGTMSRKWWYRIIQAGKIAHHRVGDTILLRAEDIDAFVADSRQESKPTDPEQDAPPAESVSVPPKVQPRKKPQADPSFFRIFPRR